MPWVCPFCDENNASYHQCCFLCKEKKPVEAKTHESVARNENSGKQNKKRRFDESELQSQSGSDENDDKNRSKGIS